ncbi:hypothetical protein IV38_GL001262 [Lactobacillus selangorensis]|uniref:Uncharacterized protein n=1 Tax=Lactobacillus selangorensis TaxID=81857 RepID=A0A0R2FMV6_9LACO|nr:hypothetical protein [Lactobacillus selangorensis]KRN29046.1 hypothetical protein IV38_GL001262 [Lactobacillus selangorensis]KRN30041.1 hypothetical protein IV40_GL002070 [Lactobacillus selangorensis]
MKLYQALTQITIDDVMVDDNPTFTIETQLQKPLHFSPDLLFHYIDAVLKPGSRHDENNLNYVSNASFITENFEYSKYDFSKSLKDFDDRVEFARNVVADLTRHVTINIDLEKRQFQLKFSD